MATLIAKMNTLMLHLCESEKKVTWLVQPNSRADKLIRLEHKE